MPPPPAEMLNEQPAAPVEKAGEPMPEREKGEAEGSAGETPMTAEKTATAVIPEADNGQEDSTDGNEPETLKADPDGPETILEDNGSEKEETAEIGTIAPQAEKAEEEEA